MNEINFSKQINLKVWLKLDPRLAPTGCVGSPLSYCELLVRDLLNNEDISEKFFYKYPEVQEFKIFEAERIIFHCIRPDDVDVKTRETMQKIVQRFPHLEGVAKEHDDRVRRKDD